MSLDEVALATSSAADTSDGPSTLLAPLELIFRLPVPAVLKLLVTKRWLRSDVALKDHRSMAQRFIKGILCLLDEPRRILRLLTT